MMGFNNKKTPHFEGFFVIYWQIGGGGKFAKCEYY